MDDRPPRRSFLNALLGGGILAWLGCMLYPVGRYLWPPPNPEAGISSVKAGTVDSFKPDSGTIVKFGSKPVLLLRTKTGEFTALAATCTHLDCIVQYRPDLGQVWCACHNGRYDLDGKMVAGPPPRPLAKYVVRIVGKEVHITKGEA